MKLEFEKSLLYLVQFENINSYQDCLLRLKLLQYIYLNYK